MATAATTRPAAAFKSAYDHDARAAESARVRQRYPDRIPCIDASAPNSSCRPT